MSDARALVEEFLLYAREGKGPSTQMMKAAANRIKALEAQVEAQAQQLEAVREACEIGQLPVSSAERYEHGKYVMASRVLAILDRAPAESDGGS